MLLFTKIANDYILKKIEASNIIFITLVFIFSYMTSHLVQIRLTLRVL